MEKLTITQVYISNKDRNGNELKFISKKDGKPVFYTKIGIKTKEYGDRWISSMATRDDDPKLKFKNGEIIHAVVEENGDFLNFKIPNKIDLLELRVESLEDKINSLVLKGQFSQNDNK